MSGVLYDLKRGSIAMTPAAADLVLTAIRRLEPTQPPTEGDGVRRPTDDEAAEAVARLYLAARSAKLGEITEEDCAAAAAGAHYMIRTVAPKACRVCGCTDHDCGWCMMDTGEPCRWVEPGLCSRCADEGRS